MLAFVQTGLYSMHTRSHRTHTQLNRFTLNYLNTHHANALEMNWNSHDLHKFAQQRN